MDNIMKRILQRIAAYVIFCSVFGNAQPTFNNDSTGLIDKETPLYATAAIGFGTVLTAVHFTRYVPLWDTYKRSFFTNGNSAHVTNYDKALHAYGGVVSSDLIASGLQLQGFGQENAVLTGAGVSSLFYLFIELEDAHINYLGFDGVDLAASVAGSGYPVLQYYVPFFNNFTPKFSYRYSGINTTMARQYSPQFLSDHEGQTYWMGVTVAGLLPASYKESYPRWLGIAAGFSMRNLSQSARQEYYITLDVDLRTIDTNSEFFNTVLRTLNYIHFPMPGMKFANGTPQFGIYF